jgi:hypothetical protein
MDLRMVASGCDGGDCPSFHRDGEREGADWIVRGPCASGEIDSATGRVKEQDLRFSDATFRMMLAQL